MDPLNPLDVLKDVAPELSPHVHTFLRGGPSGRLKVAPDWAQAIVKLRRLVDFTHNAVLNDRDAEHVAILAVAVRLQAAVLHETLKHHYAGR